MSERWARAILTTYRWAGAAVYPIVGGYVAWRTMRTANMEALLQSEGATKEQVVKTTVFLRHMSDYPLMNEVYTAFFGDHRPARSAIGVAELPIGALVEIEAWAHVA